MAKKTLNISSYLPYLQPFLLTPLLLFAFFAYSYELPSIFLLISLILENALFCFLLSKLMHTRAGKVFAVFLLLFHSFVVATDQLTLYMLGGPMDGPLLNYIISAIVLNVATKTSANELLPVMWASSFVIELAVVFGPQLLKSRIPYIALEEQSPTTSKYWILTFFKRPAHLLLLVYIIMYCLSGYAPILSFSVSSYKAIAIVLEGVKYKGTAGKCDTAFTDESFKLNPRKKLPNLILILQESLGNHVFRRPEAQANAPFYHSVLRSETDVFFEFPNTRTNGGNTESAAPAAVYGYLIATETSDPEVDKFYTVPSLPCMAKRLNYSTAVYSSYGTYYPHGWKTLNGMFDPFEVIVSKTTLRAPTVNDMGMDDRVITDKLIHDFLDQQTEEKPFFLMIVWNNHHVPFFVDESFVEPQGSEEDIRLARAIHTVGITDRMLKQVFKKLEEKNLLNNTVIGSLSDHGESAPKRATRITHPDSTCISSPFWIRAPKHLLNDSERHVLQSNTKKLISNLDMVPTLTEILGWTTEKNLFSFETPISMTHGQSLLRPVNDTRVVPGWQGQPFVLSCPWNFGFLSNQTHNVIFKPARREIVVEEVDNYFHTRIQKVTEWSDLNVHEQIYWQHELKKYPGMLQILRKCGLRM